MLDLLKMYWLDFVVIIVFLWTLAFLYKKGKKEFVRKVVLSLVVQAEKALGSGTGELKYAMVVQNIYKVLPFVLRVLITEKELDRLIEDGVQFMKQYLSKDKDLLGYEDEFLKVNFDNELQKELNAGE